MLKLAGREPFAIGGTRRCYVHPEDEQRCVKVLRADRTAAMRLQAAHGWRKLKGRRGFDDQRKELKAYRTLERRGMGDWTHVPRCFGAVETGHGRGHRHRPPPRLERRLSAELGAVAAQGRPVAAAGQGHCRVQGVAAPPTSSSPATCCRTTSSPWRPRKTAFAW